MGLGIRENVVVLLVIDVLGNGIGILRLVLKLESYTLIEIIDLFILPSVNSMIYILVR